MERSGLSLASNQLSRAFGPADLMGQVNTWLQEPDLLQRLAKLGGAPEGTTDRMLLDAFAKRAVAEILREEMPLDGDQARLEERYGPEVMAALTARGLHQAAGRTLVRLEAILSGRTVAEVALDRVADPDQLVLTRKEEQYLRLAREGRFDVLDPQFREDPSFLPYRDLWSRVSQETRQAILDAQRHWSEVAGYWGAVLRGEKPQGPPPVDWWGVRGAALEHVERRTVAELTSLEEALQGGRATAGDVGAALQRLDVYRDALGDERFDLLLQQCVTAETREWLSFRDQFVEGKRSYWHRVITDGKDAADRWDAEHYQPLRAERDAGMGDPVYGPLVQAIQAEALAVHEAYAALYQAKAGWWEASRAGRPTAAFEARGVEARKLLSELDPEAEGLWGAAAPPWNLDLEQRALWEQDRARPVGQWAARSADELRAKFEAMGWTSMVPHADLIWKASQKHGVQAEIVAAVIWQESRGDANAGVNRPGKGLMQIEFSAHKQAIPGATDEQKLAWIMTPENNVDYGTELLAGWLNAYIGKYGFDEGLKRGLQYYNYGSGAAAWVEAHSKGPEDWQYWVDWYHNTRKFDETTGELIEVSSGGKYGNPRYGKEVSDLYRELMKVELPSLQPWERQYDGKRPAEGTTDLQVWMPITAPLRSAPGQRSAALYLNVVDQFAVAHNPRYRHRDTTGDGKADTFCNIFVWDVTLAMGAEIPHWVMPDGSPARPGADGADELDANRTFDWLVRHGHKHGWREVTAAEAQAWANAGKPAVAAWHSGSGAPGHIAMVIPGQYDATEGPTIAQAGAINANRLTVLQGFGKERMAEVRYFVHE